MHKLFLLLYIVFSFSIKAQTVGLFYNLPGAASGYVLFAPGESDTTYLIDKCGKRIHQWVSGYRPGLAVYLLEDGSLLRCDNFNNGQFDAGGSGGLIEKLDWNSNVLWSYQIADFNQCQHHDAIQLPNGNILAIVWESHLKSDAEANGRVTLGNKMWSEKLVEIQPDGANSGTIVWQWRVWDHLIQQADSTKLNFGVVYDHPELFDINIGTLNLTTADWLHFNSIDYNVDLDQVMVSCHELSEMYIIDHSTTMEEAATHSGGQSGTGGDLMYRWGNPQNYGRGTSIDQKFFKQHNVHWIADGEVLLFNNGIGRPGDDYSTVETFTLPEMADNKYPLLADSAYAPKTQDWVYTADPPGALFSNVEGGAQRLFNGNTLICNGIAAEFTEIDSQGNILWKYISPVDKNHIVSQGEEPILNDCFRATYLPSYYPGFAGHTLTAGLPLEVNPDSYDCDNFPTVITGVQSLDENFKIYPNPFHNQFYIHVPISLQHASIQIHDVTGNLLYEEKNITIESDFMVTLKTQHQQMIIVSVADRNNNYGWKITAISD